MCLADPDQIAQVFWNLARNALEAMPDGGRLGRDACAASAARSSCRCATRARHGRATSSAACSSRFRTSSAAGHRPRPRHRLPDRPRARGRHHACAARRSRGREFDVRLPLVAGRPSPHERGPRAARRALAAALARGRSWSPPSPTRSRGPRVFYQRDIHAYWYPQHGRVPRARWPRGRGRCGTRGWASARRCWPTPASSSPTRRRGSPSLLPPAAPVQALRGRPLPAAPRSGPARWRAGSGSAGRRPAPPAAPMPSRVRCSPRVEPVPPLRGRGLAAVGARRRSRGSLRRPGPRGGARGWGSSRAASSWPARATCASPAALLGAARLAWHLVARRARPGAASSLARRGASRPRSRLALGAASGCPPRSGRREGFRAAQDLRTNTYWSLHPRVAGRPRRCRGSSADAAALGAERGGALRGPRAAAGVPLPRRRARSPSPRSGSALRRRARRPRAAGFVFFLVAGAGPAHARSTRSCWGCRASASCATRRSSSARGAVPGASWRRSGPRPGSGLVRRSERRAPRRGARCCSRPRAALARRGGGSPGAAGASRAPRARRRATPRSRSAAA